MKKGKQSWKKPAKPIRSPGKKCLPAGLRFAVWGEKNRNID